MLFLDDIGKRSWICHAFFGLFLGNRDELSVHFGAVKDTSLGVVMIFQVVTVAIGAPDDTFHHQAKSTGQLWRGRFQQQLFSRGGC